IFMAYFAKSTLAFDTPTTFSSFMAKDDLINIKKAAIFPIVQGIRSLALKEKIKETTTIKRIKILEARNILEKTKAAELIEAFEIASTLRLKNQLDCIQEEVALTNEINTNDLGKIERDLLKESFKIVVEFKKFINYIFKLDKIY
ncbi:putative nucleotidyltransferase substrate binding domain-containing protein, partial [Aliarcobacter butzleri]